MEKEYHPFINGPNNKNKDALEEKTGARINVPPLSVPKNEIVVAGEKEGVRQAVASIMKIYEEKVRHRSLQPEWPVVLCRASPILAVVRGQKSYSHICFRCSVSWSEKASELSYREFLLQKKKCQTVSVEVRKSQHKYVIGSRGSNLNEILETTGVSVEVPPLDSLSETITLRGEQDKLGPALTMVYSKVNIQPCAIAIYAATAMAHQTFRGDTFFRRTAS